MTAAERKKKREELEQRKKQSQQKLNTPAKNTSTQKTSGAKSAASSAVNSTAKNFADKAISWANSAKKAASAPKPSQEKVQTGTEALAKKWVESAADLYKQFQGRNSYDSQFTKEYFDAPEYDFVNDFKLETATGKQVADYMDMYRKIQAGNSYRSKYGAGVGADYQQGDELFAFNDATNQYVSNTLGDWFKNNANEEDIQYALDSWKKSIADADADSDYFKRTSAAITELEDWAGKNFSLFAHKDEQAAIRQIVANNMELDKLNTAQQDYDILSHAMAQLRDNDPVAVFKNNSELRKIVGFDELEAQSGGDYWTLHDSVLTKAYDILDGTAATGSEAAREALMTQNDMLRERAQEANDRRSSLLDVENYKKQVEAAFTTGAYNEQNIDPYKAYTEYEWSDPTLGISEARFKVNIPTFQQMVADPEGVAAEYKIAVGAGAPPGLSQQIDLVRQLSKEELAGLVRYAKDNDWDAAEEFFDTELRNEVMRRQTEEFITRAKEEANTNPILSNIAQTGYRVLGNLQNVAGGISVLFGGEPNQYNQFEAMADTTQETHLKNLTEATPWANVTVGDHTVNLLGLVLQAGYAVADEATSKLLYGGLSPFMMALSSGSKQTVDVYNETGNRLTAALSGAIGGASEYFSESAGDKLLGDVDMLADGVFKYIVANAAGESAEELLSSFASEGGDFVSHILTGEKNERQKKYEYYLNNGYDEGGALLKILEEFGVEAAQTAIVGALAGAGMSAGNAAVNMPAVNAKRSAVGTAVAAQGNIIPLLKEGMQSKNRTAKRLSERLYNKLVENNGNLPDDAETNAEVQLAQEELAKEKTITKQSREPDDNREGATITKPLPQQETEITKQSEPLENREGASVTKPLPKANESAPKVKKQVRENQETGKTSIRKPLNKTDAQQQNDQTLKTPTRRDIRQIGMVYSKVMKALDVEITGDMKKVAKDLRSRMKKLGQDQGEGVSEAIAAAVKGKATPDQLDIVEAVAMKEGILKDLVDAYGGLKKRVAETADMLVKTVTTAPEGDKQAEMPEKKIAYADTQNKYVSIEVDGQNITAPISSFTSDGKGGVAAVVAGRIVPVNQLSSGDEGMDMLIGRAAQLRDANAANAMMEAYSADQDVNSFADAFEVAYRYGQVGRNEVMARRSTLVDLLDVSQFKQAYEAGKTERASRPLARASAKGGEVRFTGDLGKRLRYLDPNQKNAIKAMTRLTKFLGTFNVEYFESKADANGNYSAENGSYDPRTNTIRIDINAGRNNKNDVNAFAMLRVASHELTHFMRAQNDEGYAKLMNYVADNLDKLTGTGFDASVLMKMDALPDLDYDAAVEEVVADACEMMLKDSDAIQQFARENQTIFKKMLDWMRSFVENVRKAFIGVSADSVEAQLLSQAEGMQKLWDDALVKAMENVKTRQQTSVELDSDTAAAIENDQPVTGDVEEKLSVRTDTPQFKRWFGDSKVVNPDGTPKIMYHGSPAQFTVFDRKKAKGSGLYGRGLYFTDSEAQAGVYGNKYAVYLKVDNPLTPDGAKITTKQLKAFLNAVAENEDYSIENYGTYDVDQIATNIESRDAFAVLQNVNATAIGDFVEAVQLFNKVNGTNFDGIVVPTETVVFEPTQIKSATDNIGTFDPENPDIRYSTRNRDAAYREAYEAGDEVTAREIIHEAAVAAGYNPMKLYHGTNAFGFTEIDPGKSDDGISFFATVDDLVAETYAGGGAKIRRVSSNAGGLKNIDELTNASDEKMLELLQKYVDPRYELLDEKDRRELIEDEGELIRRRVIWKAEEFRSDHMSMFEDSATMKAFDKVIEALDRLSYGKNHDLLERLYDAYVGTLDELYAASESVWSGLLWAISDDVNMRHNNMLDYAQGSMFMIDDTANFSIEYTNRRQAINTLSAKLFRGIYELYGRTENLLHVNGHGASWNRLDGAAVGKDGKYVNTRDYAEYAKANGYDGVYFHDIVDMGGLSNYKASSDVLTFFKPEDIKSADPFTYDDDGELIMPSKRFDSGRRDIRYSKRYANGKPVAWVDQNILAGKEAGKKDVDVVHDYLTSHIGDVFTILESGQKVYLGENLPDEYTHSKYTQYLQKNRQQLLRDKNRMTGGIGDAIEIATDRRWEKTEHPTAKDAKYGFYRYKSKIAFPAYQRDGTLASVHAYDVELLIRNASDKKKYLYDIVNIKKDAKSAIDLYNQARRGGTSASRQSSISYGNSIAQEADSVKKFSRRTLTSEDRDMLMSIADKYATTKPQKELLGRYRAKTSELIDTRTKLEEARSYILRLQRQILEAEPGTTGKMRTERLQYENRAKIYETQINRLNEEIYKLLQSKTMQTVLGEVMDVVNRQEKLRRKEFVRQYREGREKTDLRRKIKALCDDFDRRLRSPTEGRYVPKELAKLVIDVRELIDVNSDRARKPEHQQKLDEKIALIKNTYERYRSDATYAFTYDDTINDMLGGLARRIGGKNIYQLSRADLEVVYETLKALKTQVSEAVQLKSGKYAANIFDMGMEMHKETMEAAPIAKGALGRFLNWQLTPDEFFARLAGHKKNSMWSKIAKSFSDGTQKMLEIQRDAYYHFRKWTESAEFDKLGSTRDKDLIDIGLKDAHGKPVKITKGMMLEIYMHMQSEDNFRAMMYGGLSVPNLKNYYSGKVKEAYGTGSVNTMGVNEDLYRLNEQLYADETTDEEAREILKKIQEAEAEGVDRMNTMREKIEKHLTDWDSGLIEAVHQWNDGKSRDYINDVTMDMYGIKKAGVKNYYTIRRDLAFVNSDFDTIRRNMNLENWGSLKERVPSKAPVLLGDIALTMDSSIKQMSRYVGYARAQRDFGKLYNIRMPGMTSSVQKAVETKFGSGKHIAGVSGSQYLENYIGDITGSRQKDRDFLSVIRRNLPRATMTLNARVAVSQLSAIPKAAAEVGWGNMLKGINPKAMFTKKAKEELARKNVWFWTRYQGEGGQREFADMKGGSNAIDKAWNWAADSKVGRYLLNWNQNFDVMATATMWNMAEAWAKSNGYTAGTAKFDEAVNQKYADIIRKTQAANTISERSDLHRSNNPLLTMYKSEAFANFNLLYDSVVKLRKYSADLKAGRNGVTQADVRSARIGLANAATSVVIGASLGNALIKLLVNMLTGQMSAYRDEDDEVTVPSTAKAIASEVASDMAGMLVLGGEIYEFFESKITGGYYTPPSDAALQELGNVIQTLWNLDADSDREDWAKAGEKIAYATCNMLGIPAKTVTRQAEGIRNNIVDMINGEHLSFEAGADRSTKTNLRRLANAEMAGDKAAWNEVYKELQENYLAETDEELTEKEFISKFKEYIGDQYKDGEMSKEDATKLLKARTDVKDEHDLFWQFDKWDYAIENDSGEGYAIFNRLKDAVASKQSSQIKSTAKFYMQHGYTEKDMRTQIKSKAKDLYCDGALTWNQALKILLDHCNSSDNDYDDVHVQYWLKDEWDYAKAHDGSTEGYAKYGDFYDAVENGRSTDQYVDELFEHNKSEKNARTAAMSSISVRYKNQYIDAVKAGDTRKANQILEWALRAYEAIGLNRNKQLRYIQKNWVDEDE